MFSILSLSLNSNNGFFIGAYHNSDFPSSTKFGGFLMFKNALKFSAVLSVNFFLLFIYEISIHHSF